jgi:hypothetical protein
LPPRWGGRPADPARGLPGRPVPDSAQDRRAADPNPRAIRALEAERLVRGIPRGEPVAHAAEAAAGISGAVEDANGSVEYKENLVRVLVERALQEAIG